MRQLLWFSVRLSRTLFTVSRDLVADIPISNLISDVTLLAIFIGDVITTAEVGIVESLRAIRPRNRQIGPGMKGPAMVAVLPETVIQTPPGNFLSQVDSHKTERLPELAYYNKKANVKWKS